jgi:hypothetical protein
MSELNSRVFLATEAIVICLPLTALFIAGVLPAQISHSVSVPERESFVDLVSGLLTLSALLCLWRLMATFVVRGRAGLRRLSTYWWVLPIASAAVAVQIAAASWAAPVIKLSWLIELVWGVPLLVPLLHLGVERCLSARANPAANTSALPLGIRTRGGPPNS